jgi:hypothetical protein
MGSRSGVGRLLACRPNGGAQDAGDFPGLLQESCVFLNSAVLQVLQPVNAFVSLFECDVQLRSKCRARAALASGAIIGAHRRGRAQKLTAGVVSLRARRQAAMEGQRGQRETASSFNEVPGWHGTGARAIRVPRESVSKYIKYFRYFALFDFPSHFVLCTFYFLPGRRHA